MLKKKSFKSDLFIIGLAFAFCLLISVYLNQNTQEGFYGKYKSTQQTTRQPTSEKFNNWASLTPDNETRPKPDKHNDKPYLYDDYIGEIKEIYKEYDADKKERNEAPNLYKYMLDEMRRINGTRKILDIRSFQEYL